MDYSVYIEAHIPNGSKHPVNDDRFFDVLDHICTATGSSASGTRKRRAVTVRMNAKARSFPEAVEVAVGNFKQATKKAGWGTPTIHAVEALDYPTLTKRNNA